MRNAIGAGHRPGARSRRTAVTEDAEAKSELATDFGISRETVYAYLRAAPGPARTNPGLDARPRFEPTDRLRFLEHFSREIKKAGLPHGTLWLRGAS